MILTATASASVLCFALLIFYLWKRFGEKYNKGRKLPPGPIRWPILGSIPQLMMVDTEYPYRQFMGLCKVYGDFISIGFGVHFAVVISSYEIMKDLLKRPEATIERFRFQFVEQRTYGENLGILWSGGEAWKEVRKFSVRKLRDFGFGKTGSIEQTVQEEMAWLMTHIREEIAGTGGIWKVDSYPLSLVAINVVWSSVGGYRFDPMSPKVQRHIELNAEIFEILRPTNLLSLFPFLKIFPKWSGYKRHGEIHGRTQQFMKDLIEEVKANKGGRQESESFIEKFLDEIEKNRGVQGTIMTEKQLIAVLMDLFLAGTDTTSTVMNWIILFFALNQNVQEKARDILKSAKNPHHIPYVRACIYEAMRLSPIATVPPARQASSDIWFGEYIIPKGTCILFNLYSPHHDKAYWGDDVDSFRPERLLDATGAELDPGKIERLAPFGFGKRRCPGDAMAMDTLFGFVVCFLSTFSVGVVEGREPTTSPGTAALTIGPKPYVVKIRNIQ